jgi:hypothetical protein
VLKGLVELIAAPPGPVARAGGVGLPIVPGLLGEVSWASTASWSTVRVAEAIVCASPLIAGASAFVTGVNAFVVGVRGFVAGAVARPTEGALVATAFVAAPVGATRAAGCLTGVAACVAAGSFVAGVPVVAEVGALGVTGAAALVTGAAAFVTGVAARIADLLVFAADAAASSAADGVLGAGTVAFGGGSLGAAVPRTRVVAWLTGSATCWTVDVTGCVACPTVPSNESAMAGEVHTARLVKAASVAPATRDRRTRSA